MTDVIVRPVRGEAVELEELLVARFDDAEEDAWDGDGEEEFDEDGDDWDDEDDDWDDDDDDWDDEDEEWGDDEDWEEGDDA